MGGSGGGGQSGKVDYPDYMKTQHGAWMTDIDGLIDSAIANNPYDNPTWYPFDPTDDVEAMLQAILDFETYLDTIEADPGIAAEAAAFSGILQTQIDADTIPSFEAGMRDINAVQTSTFVIGKALLYARKDEQVAQFTADLKGKLRHQIIEERRLMATHYVEAERLLILAMKEHLDEWIEFETAAVKWDLELYTYGANMLAAIGGAHGVSNPAKPGKAQSALGGAMAGAAAGTAISPGWGTAIGAVVGGIGGYLAGS